MDTAEADGLRARIAELERALNAAQGAPAVFQGGAIAPSDEVAVLQTKIASLQLELSQAQEAYAEQLAFAREDLKAAKDELKQFILASNQQAATAAFSAQEINAFDPQGHKRRMGAILLEAGVINEEQLGAALAEQAANPQRRVGAIVVERGFTTEEVVARIVAAQLRLPFVALSAESLDAAAAGRISAHLARLHKAVPIAQGEDTLIVAMANPLDLIAIEDIEIASRTRVEPVVATRSAIDAVLATLG